MKHTITHYVIDNDPKGLTGVGTIFGVSVKIEKDKEIYNHEIKYSLFDLINKKIDVKKECQKIIDSYIDEDEEHFKKFVEERKVANKDKFNGSSIKDLSILNN